MSTAPVHFKTAAEWRVWLDRHHATAREAVLLFYNKASGRGGISYAEALDEALCHGWIDGIIHKIDAESHTRRFTPRRPGSIWSNINLGHIDRLRQAGRMQPAGEKAFAARTAAKTGIYSFEQRPESWPADLEKEFRRNGPAWAFWERLPPGYRRRAIWWVISAKRDATRDQRLRQLIALSASGKRFG